jgi:hypothetical protein
MAQPLDLLAETGVVFDVARKEIAREALLPHVHYCNAQTGRPTAPTTRVLAGI